MLNLKKYQPKAISSPPRKPLIYHQTRFFNPIPPGLSWLSPKNLLKLVLVLIGWYFGQEELLSTSNASFQIAGRIAFPFILFALLLHMLHTNFKRQQGSALEALRTKLSADLHDDVGAILSGLAMQAEILECDVEEKQKGKVRRLADMSRRAMAQMRDTVWALDARKDNWGSLVDRLHDHASEILEPKQIGYSIRVEGINRHKNLEAEVRQHLYLIGKEAITNAAKHSNADQLNILLRQKDNLLEMFIQDNGHLDQAQSLRSSGLGLANISHRAKQLGAQLSINYQNGFGISLCLLPQ